MQYLDRVVADSIKQIGNDRSSLVIKPTIYRLPDWSYSDIVIRHARDKAFDLLTGMTIETLDKLPVLASFGNSIDLNYDGGSVRIADHSTSDPDRTPERYFYLDVREVESRLRMLVKLNRDSWMEAVTTGLTFLAVLLIGLVGWLLLR